MINWIPFRHILHTSGQRTRPYIEQEVGNTGWSGYHWPKGAGIIGAVYPLGEGTGHPCITTRPSSLCRQMPDLMPNSSPSPPKGEKANWGAPRAARLSLTRPRFGVIRRSAGVWLALSAIFQPRLHLPTSIVNLLTEGEEVAVAASVIPPAIPCAGLALNPSWVITQTGSAMSMLHSIIPSIFN